MKKGKCGSTIVDVVIFAGVFVFVLIPIFSFGTEKFLMQARAAEIRDSVDTSALSTYYAISTERLSKAEAYIDPDEALTIFRSLLSQNLKLTSDLQPLSGSIADGQVDIKSFQIYTSGFPTTCLGGNIITRPSVHCEISVPVKPAMLRKMILDLFGREFVNLEIHLDSEIPVDR